MSRAARDAPLAFCFGVHNHQPVGNFEHVLAEATERSYGPFLERLERRPDVRVTTHWTGSLLEWVREHAPRTFDLLATLVARGQIELLTGGYYEPILAILPDHDKRGQIERLTAFIKAHFGVRPRGMWLAERVWEPHLPRTLREAGVEYVLVDDSHFALAGLDPDELGGYFLTEEQGSVLAVFPINQRLRYLIPFQDVEATIDHLASRRGAVPALTMVDDGEKFGVWPDTYAHVYERGWLDRFFDRLLATPWIELTTLGDIVDRRAASGRVYLPTASYREMGEWALGPAAGRELRAAKRLLAPLAGAERLQALLRTGFWRAFLIKYPEVADFYWKMVRLSHAIERERAARCGEARLEQAREALWRGQANDAYWHGVFGGCYLPHLRRAVKQSLLEAEHTLAAVTGPGVAWTRGDVNADGREEIVVRTEALAVTVNPTLGGAITELGYLPRGLDLADVLTRRPEVYHDLLTEGGATGAEVAPTVKTDATGPAPKEAGLAAHLRYDGLRRASLLDGLFVGTTPLDPVGPWEAARVLAGAAAWRAAAEAGPHGVDIQLTLDAAAADGLRVEKRIVVRESTVAAHYRLGPLDVRGDARWAVQWNLALTAGEAPGRYLALPGRPSLGSAGRRTDLREVTLVDEWAGIEVRLAWSPSAEIAWGPVETVSVSEGGFERIYQGTAFLIVWTRRDVSSEVWEVTTDLRVGPR